MRNNTIKIILFLCIVMTFVFTMSAHADAVLEVGIPGQIETAPGASLPSVPQYIKFIYLFVFGFVGIAGFVSLVIWGTVWTASGIVDKKAAALSNIKNTFIGIGLALSAFIILNTINPELVILRTPTPPKADITASNISPAVKGTWLCPNDDKEGYLSLSSKSLCNDVTKKTSCSSEIQSCYLQTKPAQKPTQAFVEENGSVLICGKGGIWACQDFATQEPFGELVSTISGACEGRNKPNNCTGIDIIEIGCFSPSRLVWAEDTTGERCKSNTPILCDDTQGLIQKTCYYRIDKTTSTPTPTPSPEPSPSTTCSEKAITECVPDSTCNWIGIFGPCEDV